MTVDRRFRNCLKSLHESNIVARFPLTLSLSQGERELAQRLPMPLSLRERGWGEGVKQAEDSLVVLRLRPNPDF